MSRKVRLAVVATHPIQYQAPIWAALARSNVIESRVFFATDAGYREYFDANLKRTVRWDVPLLDGYDSEFLKTRKVRFFGSGPSAFYPVELDEMFPNFDCVLVHGYSSAAAVAALRAARKAGIRIIMRGESHLRERRSIVVSSLKAFALPFLLRGVDAFLAVGSLNADYWRHYGVPLSKIETALYSIDVERFRCAAESQSVVSAELRRRWVPSAGVVFLFCAKLTPIKNPVLLLRAFSKVASNANCALVFVGSGPLERVLRKQAEGRPNIFFEGFVNQSELAAYYAAADVTVLPSVREPWGLVVNESLACGTPVISSDVVGAAPDLISAFRAGTTFKQGSETALVSAMECALDERERESWRRNTRAAADAASVDRIVAALERVCVRLASERSI